MANSNQYKVKIVWTEGMLQTLIRDFPIMLNRDVAAELGVSSITMHRKVRELGLKKAPDFKERTRERKLELQRKAPKRHHANSGSFKKGEHRCPEHEFKKGQRPTSSPEQETKRVENMKRTLVKTIYDERVRLKYGLPQQTKLKLIKRYNIKRT